MDACAALLKMPDIVAGLQGTLQQRHTQLLALMVDDLRSHANNANVEPVWEALLEQGYARCCMSACCAPDVICTCILEQCFSHSRTTCRAKCRSISAYPHAFTGTAGLLVSAQRRVSPWPLPTTFRMHAYIVLPSPPIPEHSLTDRHVLQGPRRITAGARRELCARTACGWRLS